MDLKGFFKHPEIQLAAHWREEDYFESFFDSKLSTFVDLLEQLQDTPVSDLLTSRRTDILEVCERLKKSLHFSLAGKSWAAYRCFRDTLDYLQNELCDLRYQYVSDTTRNTAYRVRQTRHTIHHRHEMFHVPFHLRHLVATQRYSVPGLPCLYLAGSLYTCWAEMGRPPLHELQCAAFWLREEASLNLLNFSQRPGMWANELDTPSQDEKFWKNIASYIVLWPLLFACSITVKHPDGAFKPEYILPQLLLQWITEEGKFDGVIYFSTHVKDISKAATFATSNIVVPTKEMSNNGHCRTLCDIFRITNPVSWDLLTSINAGDSMPMESLPYFSVEFVRGVEECYAKTQFGLNQIKLGRLAMDLKRRYHDGDHNAGHVNDSGKVAKNVIDEDGKF